MSDISQTEQKRSDAPDGSTRMLGSLECARLASLLAIIFIHVSAFGFFGADIHAGFLVEEFARFGVPVFFMISGFLWKQQTLDQPVESLVRLFRKLAIPMLVWTLVYLVLDKSALIYAQSFEGGILAHLAIPLTGGPGFHLWFLPALFMGTALCWFGLKVTGRRQIFAVAVALYIVGILIGAYGPLFGLKVQNLFYRNGIFLAPLFLMLGHIIAVERVRVRIPVVAVLIILGFILHVIEGYFISARFPHGQDFSFGTALFGVGMFLGFLALPPAVTRPKMILDAGRCVFGAYILHLMILYIIVEHVAVHGFWVAIAIGVIIWILSLAAAWQLRLSRLGRIVLL